MSKKQKKVRLTEVNAKAYDDYSEETGSKTALVNTLFDSLREFESVKEFEQVIEKNSTGESEGLVLKDSVQVSQLEPGHGVPLTLDEAMDLQIATEAKQRVAVLEAVILGEEDTHVSESRIDYLINQLYFNPADSTRDKYKTILLNKTEINALPGSDPRIMEPVGDYHVAAVESDPDKYDVTSIPSESKRSFVDEMRVSDALYPVWDDIGTGFVTDSDVWTQELFSLVRSSMRSVAELSTSDSYAPNRGMRYGSDGKLAALKLLLQRIDRVVTRTMNVDVSLIGIYHTINETGFEYFNTNMDGLEESMFSDVSESDVQSAKEVLGVDTTTTDAVIDAFRDKVRQAHPDMGGSDAEFKRVVEAKETLVKA